MDCRGCRGISEIFRRLTGTDGRALGVPLSTKSGRRLLFAASNPRFTQLWLSRAPSSTTETCQNMSAPADVALEVKIPPSVCAGLDYTVVYSRHIIACCPTFLSIFPLPLLFNRHEPTEWLSRASFEPTNKPGIVVCFIRWRFVSYDGNSQKMNLLQAI